MQRHGRVSKSSRRAKKPDTMWLHFYEVLGQAKLWIVYIDRSCLGWGGLDWEGKWDDGCSEDEEYFEVMAMFWTLIGAWVMWEYLIVTTDYTIDLRAVNFTMCKLYLWWAAFEIVPQWLLSCVHALEQSPLPHCIRLIRLIYVADRIWQIDGMSLQILLYLCLSLSLSQIPCSERGHVWSIPMEKCMWQRNLSLLPRAMWVNLQ